MSITDRQVIKAIISSLSPELLTPKYRRKIKPQDSPVKGHCAVVSEAFYHLAGGKAAGYIPAVCGYFNDAGEKETHWWLRGPQKGERGQGAIIDISAAQYPNGFDYSKGHNCGFMQPQQKPSKRAQIVIDRVTATLGAADIEKWRTEHISDFITQKTNIAADEKPQRVLYSVKSCKPWL